MSETSTRGKYQVVPTRDQLEAVVKYFKQNMTDKGRIYFTQREMLEDDIIKEQFKSASYLNGVNTYLTNEGFITKIEIGSRHIQSTWDVSKLVSNWERVITREEVGSSRPTPEQIQNVKVEIIRNEEATKTEAPKVVEQAPQEQPVNNTEVIKELKGQIGDLIGYLQALPAEIGTNLNRIAGKLDLADPSATERLNEEVKELQGLNEELKTSVENVEAQKKDLEDEVQRLKTQLEEVSGKNNINTHHIYRQRNLIMDEVDRMISAPSWQMRQQKINIRNSIENKLDSMMSEIGIDKPE